METTRNSKGLLADAAELSDIVRDTADSIKPDRHKYRPDQMPFFDETYSWADRQSELELLANVLSLRLKAVHGELAHVHDICRTRDYPSSIMLQDDPMRG
jgi:hypothetical protein